MEQELAEPKYVPLEERELPVLKDVAKKLGLKFAPAIGREKLVHAIKVEQTKRQLKAEDEARRQLEKESEPKFRHLPDGARKPSFEEVAINGGEFLGKQYPPSPKRLVRFINTKDPGSDKKFMKGPIFFHIFDKDKKGKPLKNVLPDVLINPKYVSEKLEDGSPNPHFDQWIANISLVARGEPVYENKNVGDGRVMSVLTGYVPVMEFVDMGPAPKNASWGLYLEGVSSDVEYQENKRDTG